MKLLVRRITGGHYPPGTRFMSDMAVAVEFNLSRPTAHALLNELAHEGYLERRRSSGTYIPGTPLRYERAHLVFNRSRTREGNFDTVLLHHLQERLSRERIPWKFTSADNWKGGSKKHFHVLWERNVDRIARELAVTRNRGLILDSIPALKSVREHFDSVSVDYFSAGMIAGRFLGERFRCRNVAILANPPGRQAWAERAMLGFRSLWPRARIIHPQSWRRADSEDVLQKIYARAHDGIFCCYYRQALDILTYCRTNNRLPPCLVALGKPPPTPNFPAALVSVSMHEFVEAAVRIIVSRMSGDPTPITHITLTPSLWVNEQ